MSIAESIQVTETTGNQFFAFCAETNRVVCRPTSFNSCMSSLDALGIDTSQWSHLDPQRPLSSSEISAFFSQLKQQFA